MSAAQPRSTMAAHSVDLIDEHNTRGILLGVFKEVPHPAGAYAHEHLHKIRSADAVKRYAGLSRYRAGQKGLSRAGRAYQQHALGNPSSQACKFSGILKKIHNLLQLILFLVSAGNIRKGLAVLIICRSHPGFALAKGHHLAASLALLEQLWKLRRLPAPFRWLGLGAAAGAAVMFTAPGYGAVGSDGLRQAGLGLMYENFLSIFIGTVVRPAIPALIITGFLLWHLRRQGCRWWKLCTLAAVPIHLVCLAEWCKDLADPGNLLLPDPSLRLALVGMALAALWLLMVLLWRGGQAKQTILRLILALCLFSAPLLVVSIGGNRNFLPGFVVLCLVCLVLYDSARDTGLKLLRWPRALALLACCALIVVYGVNCRIYYQRLAYAREQVAAGAEQITLPLLPFAGFARNEQEWKGDLSYQIYRETPWDVGFTFISYEKWAQSGQRLGGD